jgi:anti-anti-sigma factor
VIDVVRPEAGGVRRLVLDLRGLTFMDVPGLRELIRQNEYTRTNHHNLALVRGTELVQRVLKLRGVDAQLILVDDPDDLVPPPTAHWTRRQNHAHDFLPSFARCAGSARPPLGEEPEATWRRFENAAKRMALVVVPDAVSRVDNSDPGDDDRPGSRP